MKKLLLLLFSILSSLQAFPESNYIEDKSSGIEIPGSETPAATQATPASEDNSSVKFQYDGIWYEIIDSDERTCKTITVQDSFSYGVQGNDVFGNLVLPEIVYYEEEPYTLTVIGRYSFSDCDGLISLTMPNTVVEIETMAFSGCGALSKVILSNALTTIGENAFNFCQRLETLEIPESVVSIKQSAFYHSGLTYLSLPPAITKVDAGLFFECYYLREVKIPSGVTLINTQAFYGSGIRSVAIPASVNTFGYIAFGYCRDLEYVINYSETPQDIKKSPYNYEVFYSTNISGCTLYVPEKSIAAYQQAYGWKDFGEIKSIESKEWEQNEEKPSDFEYDGLLYTVVDPEKKTCKTKSGSWDGAGNPEASGNIDLPSVVSYEETEYTLVEIGDYSFYGCKELVGIEIPSTVTVMGRHAFEDSGIVSVGLPETIKIIHDMAFYGCGNLSLISFPKSLTYIGDFAFYECGSLPSLYAEGEELYIGKFAFYGCGALQSVNLGHLDFATLMMYAFAECTNLESVYLPSTESEALLEPYVFKNCINLKEIIMPSLWPPYLSDDNVFYNVDKSACVLYVPEEAIEYYREANVWNTFENIKPIEELNGGEEPEPDPEDPEEPSPAPEEKECNIVYYGMDGNNLGSESLTFTLPVPEKIEGYVFVKWIVVGGDLDEGIRIQAVYEEDQDLGVESEMESMPKKEGTQKIIRNGKIYIIKGDKIVDLTGIEKSMP